MKLRLILLLYWSFIVFWQGVPGAYSESAAEKAYPNCEAVPCEQFETAFEVCIAFNWAIIIIFFGYRLDSYNWSGLYIILW